MTSTTHDPDAADPGDEKAGPDDSAPAVPPPSNGAGATDAKASSSSRPLYSLAQTGWTRRLCVQMAVYCGFIALSMLAGGAMPIWLDRTDAWGTYRRRAEAEREAAAAAARDAALLSFCPRPAEEEGSSLPSPAWRNQTLARGSPPPPLQVAELPPAAPNTTATPRLVDASARARAIALRGVSWPGFDRPGAGFVDNIGPKAPSTLAATAGGGGNSSSGGGGATPLLPPSGLADAAALIYQMRLLGFNAVRLPFDFDALSDAHTPPSQAGWALPCRRERRGELARRATDPAADVAGLKFFMAPGPAVPLDGEEEEVVEDAEQQQQQRRRRRQRRLRQEANEEEPSPLSPPPEAPLCNARVPPPADAATRDRMLWLVRLLVGNGFYVVLDEQPQQQRQRGGPVPPRAVAESQQQQQWAALWRSVACLPHFAADLRGRVLLAPAGEPTGSLLETMDAVERAAPGTGALFVVPMAAAAAAAAESSSSSFFRELAGRAYADRAVLAAGENSLETVAGVCATAAAAAAEGAPATKSCRRFPVLLADVGAGDAAAAVTPSKSEVAQLRAAGEAMQRAGVSGWFWSPWTATTTRRLGTPAAVAAGSLFDFPQSGATFCWPRLRLLLAGDGGLPGFGLAPWYRAPKEFAAREAAAAEAARWRRVRDEEEGGGRQQASSSWLWDSKGAAGARARGGD
jgi:hypothetical protein